MSGRLIILPKKSWHPGKRENIEKVLRDERLAKEEAAAARERAREIAQEGIVETLSKKRLSAGEKKESKSTVPDKPKSRKRSRQSEDQDKQPLGGKGQGWGGTLQHVNLFSEAEREAGKVLGQNADHQREKREQDLQKQQRSGLAPTALGEGSAELRDKDSQPWYTQAQESLVGTPEAKARTMRLGREVMGEEAVAALKRDEGRKGRADPMGFLFRSPPQAHMPGNLLPTEEVGANSASKGSKAASAVFSGVIADGESDRGTSTHSGGKKRHKKSKKSKKHRKKESSGKRRSADSNSRGGGCAAGATDELSQGDEADASRHNALEDLRRRRLAREGGERERQIRLLAEREMAGKPLPDDRSRSYNNQYNAPVARQNRAR
eukprot:jgi/Undpi1/2451/HiC_scaffold_13.g05831.m1